MDHKGGLVAYGKEKVLSLSEIEPRFHGHAVRGPVTNTDAVPQPLIKK